MLFWLRLAVRRAQINLIALHPHHLFSGHRIYEERITDLSGRTLWVELGFRTSPAMYLTKYFVRPKG